MLAAGLLGVSLCLSDIREFAEPVSKLIIVIQLADKPINSDLVSCVWWDDLSRWHLLFWLQDSPLDDSPCSPQEVELVPVDVENCGLATLYAFDPTLCVLPLVLRVSCKHMFGFGLSVAASICAGKLNFSHCWPLSFVFELS